MSAGGVRSVDEHLAECLAAVEPLPARAVPLLEALGCRLAEDVVSDIDMPRFDNSSMDGYAVRAAELAGAAEGNPVRLPVRGDIQAGEGRPPTLEPGTTLRIMTGAPIPDGADAVLQVEWTDGGTEWVTAERAPVEGQHIRRSGEDVRVGETVVRSGTRLTPRHLALLAAVGRAQVRVVPRPRVLVLPSGNELVPPGEQLGPGQIHDSNGYGLVAAVRELGLEAEHGGVIEDHPEAVAGLLKDAAARADLIVTTGGVSAGAYDTVKEVLSGFGTVWFGPVAMQPGRPQGFGAVDGTPIVTLPGNPVSALVSFEVFVRPVLLRLAGHDLPEADLPEADQPGGRPVVTAVAEVGWRSPAAKRQFVRGSLRRDGDRLLVRPVGGQGSHLVADLAEANCLAVVGEDVTAVAAGDEIRCMVLDDPLTAVPEGAL